MKKQSAQKHSMFSIEGRIINHSGESKQRVEVNTDTGIVVKITEPTGSADLILQDELIFPGFVDLHVHAREDASGKETYKEDFQSMGEAALHGGVCCVADMPNNLVAPVNDSLYQQKLKLARACKIPVLLYAGIGSHTKPLATRIPYKVFMGPSIGDLFFRNFSELEHVLARYKGQAISFHCENPEMINGVDRPPEAEISAIEFALELIEKYNLQGKICHCSTKKGIEKIAAAKKQGIQVTCEVTPHHLYFDDTNITEKNHTWLRVNPPMRSSQDRLALISALKNGTIDYLATDHAPHTIKEKGDGVSGMPHLDTYGLFITWLMKEHDFLPQDIARICAYNPGQFTNQFSQEKYGEIKEGYIGSFTIIDPSKPTTVLRKDLQTKCSWSPFEGVEFPGQVVYTIHKGRIAYETRASHH